MKTAAERYDDAIEAEAKAVSERKFNLHFWQTRKVAIAVIEAAVAEAHRERDEAVMDTTALEAVSQAIMAERARCAAVARSFKDDPLMTLPRHIAEAIERGDEQ